MGDVGKAVENRPDEMPDEAWPVYVTVLVQAGGEYCSANCRWVRWPDDGTGWCSLYGTDLWLIRNPGESVGRMVRCDKCRGLKEAR